MTTSFTEEILVLNETINTNILKNEAVLEVIIRKTSMKLRSLLAKNEQCT